MINFESARLVYKPLTHDHLEDFHIMESDPEVLKYYRREPVKSLEETKVNLEKYFKYASDHTGLGAWSVFTKDTNEFVGLGVIIHLNKDPKNKDYEIGYRLPQNNWGKGYATEIAKAFIDYSFQHLKLTHIFGTTHPENLNSQKVLQKVGFVYVGEGTYHGGEAKLFKRELPY